MTTFTEKRISLLSFGFLAVGLTACGQAPAGPASDVSVSSRATQAGVFKYTLVEGQTSDVLQEQNADGALLGTWARDRNTGVATQTWTDSNRNVWELSSASGCLSRNGTCVGGTEPGPEEVAVQAERSVAAQADLNGYLNVTNPFATSGRPAAGASAQHGGHQSLVAECVAVFDLFCSTSLYCAAMGGTFECGLFATRCCF